MLRRMTEVLLGPVTVRRRLPKMVGGGSVIANPKVGGLRYLFRSSEYFDPVLYKVARALIKPNDIVWDVGGNVGLFAASASGLAGSGGAIYTIEADKDAFELLLRTANSQPSNHAPINCLNVAVSNQCGVVQFNIAKRSRSANFIAGFGSTQTGGITETRLVPSLTLDVLLSKFPSPKVIKIDIEGAELLALEGAQDIFLNVRPAIFVEVGTEAAKGVAEFLRRNEYRILDGTSLLEIRDDESAPWDTVAIPMESDLGTALNENHF
jgi:FkbM family methyltransferase